MLTRWRFKVHSCLYPALHVKNSHKLGADREVTCCWEWALGRSLWGWAPTSELGTSGDVWLSFRVPDSVRKRTKQSLMSHYCGLVRHSGWEQCCCFFFVMQGRHHWPHWLYRIDWTESDLTAERREGVRRHIYNSRTWASMKGINNKEVEQ